MFECSMVPGELTSILCIPLNSAPLGVPEKLIMHPCEDTIFGMRMLLSSSSGACAFKGGQNCSSYAQLGTVMTAASAVDLILSSLVSQGYDKFFLYFLRGITRKVCLCLTTSILAVECPTIFTVLRHLVWLHLQVVLEGSMLLCEATVFTCSILALKWEMTAYGGEGGYEDMALYSMMCSISTVAALLITVTLLIVPEHVCPSNSLLQSYHLPCNSHFISTQLRILHYSSSFTLYLRQDTVQKILQALFHLPVCAVLGGQAQGHCQLLTCSLTFIAVW